MQSNSNNSSTSISSFVLNTVAFDKLGTIAARVPVSETMAEVKAATAMSKKLAKVMLERFQNLFYSCADDSCNVVSFRYSDYVTEYATQRHGMSPFEVLGVLLKASNIFPFSVVCSMDNITGEVYFTLSAMQFMINQRETFRNAAAFAAL
jgi:hypothetical protein